MNDQYYVKNIVFLTLVIFINLHTTNGAETGNRSMSKQFSSINIKDDSICEEDQTEISLERVIFENTTKTSDGQNKNVNISNRIGKQLLVPFFRVGLVRFVNGECTGYGSLVGTCYTRRQCNATTGTPSTTCASSIGVCCIIYRNCGGSSNINNTYFISSGFPATYSGNSVCTYTIQKTNSNICQVRIDFLTMTLAQPNANGSCATDAVVITGGASTLPVLCGENSGQHVYVDFNGNASIIISIVTTGTAFNRAWNIRVAQINCNCPTRAPSGCLQYFNATTGTVRSFNYGSTTAEGSTRQLTNQNYGVCIAMIAGYCGITWSQTATTSFGVTGDTSTSILDATVGTVAAELFGVDCTTDFVVIPSPIIVSNATTSTSDRFCGNGFTPVTSNSKPFVLTVVTNSDETNDVANVGFSLNFAQTRCATIVST